MTIDITEQFLDRDAIYNSPITKTKVPIKIKSVQVRIVNSCSITTGKVCKCTILSDKGNYYSLDELTFEYTF